MFVKIQKPYSTVCYTCDWYAFKWRENPTGIEPKADVTLFANDGNVIVDFPVHPGFSVYAMNEAGKTIDSYQIT